MDFLGDGNFNDSSRVNGSSFNFNNSEDSKMRSACDGRFSWTVHGPLIVVSTLIVILNSIVLALMRRKERLQTLSNTILASLAVSDLMSGLFGVALFFGCSVAIMAGHIALCVSSTLFMRFTAVSTVLHFLLVACDRHIMITFSLRYQALVNKCRVRGALIAIWLMSTLVATVELTWFETKITKNSMEKDKIYSILFIVVFLAVPLLSILCIYGHIIVVSTRHLLPLRARRTNIKDEATKARSIARDLRGTAILISTLVVFAGCWLPFFLMILQDYLGARIISTTSWRLCLLLFARFIPPVTNPVLCALCKRDFRDALRACWQSLKMDLVGFTGNVFHKKSRKQVNNSRGRFTKSEDGSANRNLTIIPAAARPSPRREMFSVVTYNVTSV